MLTNTLQLIRRVTSLSNPELWTYSLGLYLFGFFWALALSISSQTISTSQFLIYFLWMVSVGMVFGLSHHKESANFIFPWRIPFIIFNYLTAPKRQKIIVSGDANVRVSIIISGFSTLLFILANSIFFNIKILLLGIGLFTVDFLYNSRHVNGKSKPLIDVLLGGVYVFPLLIGYVLVTDKWPDALLIIASLLYAVAIEAYSRTIDYNEHLRGRNTSITILGKEKLLLASIISIVLCGVILASYNPLLFLITIPFLIISILGLRAKSHDEMVKIYSKIFLTHTLMAFFIISYFFIISSL